MNDKTEQAEEWSPAETEFRTTLSDAINDASNNDVTLNGVLSSMAEYVARLLLVAQPDSQEARLSSVAIFHHQTMNWMAFLGELHDPDTCPDCIAAGGGRTVQ